MTAKQDQNPDKDQAASADRTAAGVPAANVLLIDVILRAGLRLGRRYLEKGLLSRHVPPEQARRIIQGRPASKSFISIMATRIASRSVPGAMLVGGGILGKMLLDRRKAVKQAEEEAEQVPPATANDT